MIVEDTTGQNRLICKGAVEKMMSLCARVHVDGKAIDMLPEYHDKGVEIASDLNGQGFRVIALTYKEIPTATDEPTYTVKDESTLILLGFLSFLDPPKDTATQALQQLHDLKVDVKILTGDNEIITAKIPFIQSRASWPLIATSLIIVGAGAWLTVSPLAGTLGFVPHPPLYWLFLAIILLAYMILTQLVKTWFYHRFAE